MLSETKLTMRGFFWDKSWEPSILCQPWLEPITSFFHVIYEDVPSKLNESWNFYHLLFQTDNIYVCVCCLLVKIPVFVFK